MRLEPVLQNRLSSWEQRVESEKASFRAFHKARHLFGDQPSEIDVGSLEQARQWAREDRDSIGEALLSVLLAREQLLQLAVLRNASRPRQPLPPAPQPLPGAVPMPPLGEDREPLESSRERMWMSIPNPPGPLDSNQHLMAAVGNLEDAIGLLTRPEEEQLKAFLHQALSEVWYKGREQQAVEHGQTAIQLFADQANPAQVVAHSLHSGWSLRPSRPGQRSNTALARRPLVPGVGAGNDKERARSRHDPWV